MVHLRRGRKGTKEGGRSEKVEGRTFFKKGESQRTKSPTGKKCKFFNFNFLKVFSNFLFFLLFLKKESHF